MVEGLTRDEIERCACAERGARGQGTPTSRARIAAHPHPLSPFPPPLPRLMFFEQAREHAEQEYGKNKRDTQVRRERVGGGVIKATQ